MDRVIHICLPEDTSQDNRGRTPLRIIRYCAEEYEAIAAKILIDRGADRLVPTVARSDRYRSCN
jgi:hypothetical protein